VTARHTCTTGNRRLRSLRFGTQFVFHELWKTRQLNWAGSTSDKRPRWSQNCPDQHKDEQLKEYLRDRDTKIICEKLLKLKTFTNCRHRRSKTCEIAQFGATSEPCWKTEWKLLRRTLRF
jgi:hypothetical protein